MARTKLHRNLFFQTFKNVFQLSFLVKEKSEFGCITTYPASFTEDRWREKKLVALCRVEKSCYHSLNYLQFWKSWFYYKAIWIHKRFFLFSTQLISKSSLYTRALLAEVTLGFLNILNHRVLRSQAQWWLRNKIWRKQVARKSMSRHFRITIRAWWAPSCKNGPLCAINTCDGNATFSKRHSTDLCSPPKPLVHLRVKPYKNLIKADRVIITEHIFTGW